MKGCFAILPSIYPYKHELVTYYRISFCKDLSILLSQVIQSVLCEQEVKQMAQSLCSSGRHLKLN